jgi:predicted RNase H-like nuclease (RuvC/YqgF family)
MKKAVCRECVRLRAEAEQWEIAFAAADAEAETLQDEKNGLEKQLADLRAEYELIWAVEHDYRVNKARIKELETRCEDLLRDVQWLKDSWAAEVNGQASKQ